MRFSQETRVPGLRYGILASMLILASAAPLRAGQRSRDDSGARDVSIAESEVVRHGVDPSWGDFRSDVGESFRCFFAWNNALPAALIGAGTGVSSRADHALQDYFSRTERLGKVSDIVSNAAVLTAGFGTLMAAGWFGDNAQLRSATYDLALGLIVNNTVTFGMKVAVRRERPDGGNFAFPSGHASNVFTIATIMGHHYGPKVSIPLHVLALLVSVARMDVNSHWLSDTVAGAGLGILAGHAVLRARAPSSTRRVTWTPVFPPGGVGFRVVVRP